MVAFVVVLAALRLGTQFHARHVLGDGRRRARETGWYVDGARARSDDDTRACNDDEVRSRDNDGGTRALDDGAARARDGGDTAVRRRSTRRSRNRAPAYTDVQIDPGTKQAVVQWIRSRPEADHDLPRLAGSELVEVSESNPLLLGPSAGNCKGANCIQPGSSASRSAAFGGVGRLGTTAKARGRGWKPTTPRTQRLASLRQELDLHVPRAGLHVRGARGGASRSAGSA